jgi:hypothetical protein
MLFSPRFCDSDVDLSGFEAYFYEREKRAGDGPETGRRRAGDGPETGRRRAGDGPEMGAIPDICIGIGPCQVVSRQGS